eukprot:Nk52_evm1s2467 gene=Nk52_evmTU1s2467
MKIGDEAIITKLKDLSGSQASIETISQWFQFYRRNAQDLVRVWVQEIRRAEPKRKLILFYLANDILQVSRKKGTEYIDTFKGVLPIVMSRDMRPQKGGIVSSCDRTLDIWAGRAVFEEEYVLKLKRALGVEEIIRRQGAAGGGGKGKSTPLTGSRTASPAPTGGGGGGSGGGEVLGRLGGMVREGQLVELVRLWIGVESFPDMSPFERSVGEIPASVLEQGELFDVSTDLEAARDRMKELITHETALNTAIAKFNRQEDAFAAFLDVANDFVFKKSQDFTNIKSKVGDFKEKRRCMGDVKEALKKIIDTLESQEKEKEEETAANGMKRKEGGSANEDTNSLRKRIKTSNGGGEGDDQSDGDDTEARMMEEEMMEQKRQEEAEDPFGGDDDDDDDEDGYDPYNP